MPVEAAVRLLTKRERRIAEVIEALATERRHRGSMRTERHGIVVLPPDINASGCDHRMERTGDGVWGVRLGLQLVAGIGEGEKERIEQARQGGPNGDLRDAMWRLRLDRDAADEPRGGQRVRPLGLSRREALWAVGMVEAHNDLLPDAPLTIPALPPLTDEEAVRRWNVLTATALDEVLHGEWARVGGVVTVRQRPGTSKGVVFITLEDETGMVNVVVMPDVYERERRTLRTASLLAVEGQVEGVDGVTHVRAARVKAFGQEGDGASLLSKHFA